MQVLITGCAGFIGFHLAKLLLENGNEVVGIDNLNDYYDVKLKEARLQLLKKYPHFTFYQQDICTLSAVSTIFNTHLPTHVVNLAAQAGVRYSLVNPHAYVQSNIVGFTNIVENCRHHQVKHLVYASTSSVYGANASLPYKESDNTNHPLTIYAASKKANELIAHSYSHLYQLPTTGLRFFTVYGPWGRPDMAFFSFTKDILEGNPIKIFNNGQMQRDFTYIDDIVVGISTALTKIPQPTNDWLAETPNPAFSNAPYQVFNIGCGQPVALMDYIEAIEDALGKKAIKEFYPMQKGDVLSTHADTLRLQEYLGYKPSIPVREGVRNFVNWYKEFYGA
ncbi:protein capI (plasmid) [Legionella adelaidensis]|uniref:Protein capI n=1 Tax=Legionella adelaidensis TaxID=45056 RepID=A0A0W0R3W4_9GAMM|nr:NAD-dependent epimerase [Legionella adelaidensis]KTC65747.1 protein capI [Legionella adelaidensis]VEH85087.1 protein capI [Legionella adelaidensis]